MLQRPCSGLVWLPTSAYFCSPLASALSSEAAVCSWLKLELWHRSYHLLRHTPEVLGFMLPWRGGESTCHGDEGQQASGVRLWNWSWVCAPVKQGLLSVLPLPVITEDTEYRAAVETLIWAWPLTSRSESLPHWFMGFVVLQTDAIWPDEQGSGMTVWIFTFCSFSFVLIY